MPKITFMGAGSTVFAKNVLGDSMVTPSLAESEIALYDVDAERLRESELMLTSINNNLGNRAAIKAYLGVENRREALRGANYVVNAIQVGGYDPCTIIDFEIPKKFGLRQTIADTLGIGGIFRALRTIPVMQDFARDIEEVCPDAWFLNYTNPMAMLTGAMLRLTNVKTVGLCHSVQVCASHLMQMLGMEYDDTVQWKIAGINHQAWLLEITKDGRDLYPELKKRALEKNKEKHGDMVRLELMRRFGYYITESSEHNSEYTPWFIKDRYPELTPKEREDAITKEHGAVFIMKIGGALKSGDKHDGRAPDYDDWELNGDIILWNEVLDRAFEISSMGIRVDEEAMARQLALAGAEERKDLPFHKAILNRELPYSIGGGIGQSRLCMYFLRKAHIGEVQASVWPDEMISKCEAAGIHLL